MLNQWRAGWTALDGCRWRYPPIGAIPARRLRAPEEANNMGIPYNCEPPRSPYVEPTPGRRGSPRGPSGEPLGAHKFYFCPKKYPKTQCDETHQEMLLCSHCDVSILISSQRNRVASHTINDEIQFGGGCVADCRRNRREKKQGWFCRVGGRPGRRRRASEMKKKIIKRSKLCALAPSMSCLSGWRLSRA